jgi:MFS family permease
MTKPPTVSATPTTGAENRPAERAGWRGQLSAVLVGSALAVVSGWNFGDLGPVADPLAAAYGVGLPAVGILITSLVLVHALGQIPAGDWTDRLGARRAGLFALLILGVGNVVAAIVPNFDLALTDRAVMGVGTAAAFISGSTFLRLASNSALAQGWLGGMAIGGSGLAIAVVPRLEPVVSWRAPYLTGLATCLPALALLAAAPSTRPAVRAASTGLRSVLAIGNTQLLRLSLLHTGSMGVSVVAAAWVVPLLTRHGESVAQASAAGSLILLGQVISRPAGGWLQMERPGWLPGLVWTGIAAVVVGMILLVGPWGTLLSTLGSTLIGVGAGLPFGLLFNEAGRSRPAAPATAVGFVNTFANGFVVVGTPLLGLAFLVRGGAGAGFLALAGFGLLSGLAMFGLRPAGGEALTSR